MRFLSLPTKIFVLAAALAATVGSSLAQNSSSSRSQTQSAPANSADFVAKLAARNEAITDDRMRIHVFRLRPGDDLLESIRTYAQAQHLRAAVVLTAVGSLTQASIRYANQPNASQSSGHFEIVALVGTVEDGGEHLHLSLGAGNGSMIGGHLMSGCKIYTTGEIVLGELQDVRFTRELDKEGSGWEELKVYPAPR